MLPEPIANEDLRPSDVPGPSADWHAIEVFALTFDGYKAHGSPARCAEVADDWRHETLTDLRTCLFFEQRRWRHYSRVPDRESMAYIHSLLARIHSRLTTPPPADPAP